MRFIRIAVLALFVVAAFAVTTTASAADDGSVSVVPSSSFVQQGSYTNVAVVIDPPPIGTSIWIIRVTYDPSVVQFVSCQPMPSPGGGIAQAFGCEPLSPTIVVTFGGWVQNVGGIAHGFETPQTAATITFKAIGPPGSQSPLHITVQDMLGPNGEVETPATNDGVIHVVAAAVGGVVEVLSMPAGGDGASTPVAILLAAGALITAGIAYAGSRRIIGR